MLKFKGNDWSETQQELVTQDSLPVLHPPWNTFFFEGQGKNIARSEQSSLPLVLWNGTKFLPWGEVKNTKFILFRASNASCLTWSTHFETKCVTFMGPCRHQPLTKYQKWSTSYKNQQLSSLWYVIWKDWDEVTHLSGRKKSFFKVMVWDLSLCELKNSE